jgi:predicted component of type VI protein secretion system
VGLRLIIEDVEGATTIVPLAEEEVTIGRKGGNTIQLTEQNVSRNHARISLVEGAWQISDLSSYNGVLVNGAEIDEPVEMREGDLIQIGDYHLVLADELDKRTADMDHPVRAANDDEPVLASSSADLPQMSPTELDALRSGPQAVATSPATDEDEDYEERGGGLGPKVLVGAILLGVVAGGAYLGLAKSDDGDAVASAGNGVDAKAEPAAEEEAAEEPVEEAPPADAGEVAATDEGEPAADDGAPEPVLAADDAGTDGGAVDVGDPEPAVEPEEVPQPAADPGPGPKKGSKKKKKNSKSKPAKKDGNGGVPPPPDGSAKSAKQLLADARRASMGGDAPTAYRLASEAYSIGKGQDALQLMGVSACKMGDAAKARSAFKKLRGQKKTNLAALCEAKGISL